LADGYMGKFLRVDLSLGKTVDEKLPRGLAQRYIGGAGIGIRLLYDEVKPHLDPLGPENELIIFTGPYQGTIAPTSGRFHITTKSPLTGLVGDANSGGHFGAYLKYAGYDGIVVRGRSPKPVYLSIDDGKPELQDASHLWGKNTLETETMLKEEIGDDTIKICSIGPAGESLVRISCIMNDLDRTAARAGNGAVMGSKNLKAITVRGNRRVEAADPDKLKEVVTDLRKRIVSSEAVVRLRTHGTVDSVAGCNDLGNLPTKNWLRNEFKEGYETISGESVTRKILVRPKACFSCPIGCGRYVKISRDGKELYSGGPEYESTAALGSLCMNSDLNSVAYANLLCNLYGMDTISVGNAVAFAMECYEKGLITSEQANSLNLKWGNAEAEEKLIEMIAKREGFLGRTLAEGVRKAAEIIGNGAEEFAVHVKGLELPMHEPRGAPGLALGYATSTRGACHLRTLSHCWEIWGQPFGLDLPKEIDRFGIEGKVKPLIMFQDLMSLMNSLVYCIFATEFNYTYNDWVNILNAATGWKFTYKETMQVGERIWNLQRLFNLREGATRKDDALPPRIIKHAVPFPDGKSRAVNYLDPMLDDYYKQREWDEQGQPTKQKLAELGLFKKKTTTKRRRAYTKTRK
jgi:aldehyde:ferredoxin oxidoreductase